MSTPTRTTEILAQRFNEMTAAAGAEQIVRILHELALEPSTKRFTRTRETRRERWLQLASIAEARAAKLNGEPAAPKKRTLPTGKATGRPITQAEIDNAANVAS